jgi:hypothetical protein
MAQSSDPILGIASGCNAGASAIPDKNGKKLSAAKPDPDDRPNYKQYWMEPLTHTIYCGYMFRVLTCIQYLMQKYVWLRLREI